MLVHPNLFLHLRSHRTVEDLNILRLLVWLNVPRPEPVVVFAEGYRQGSAVVGSCWTVRDGPKGPRVEPRYLRGGRAYHDKAHAHRPVVTDTIPFGAFYHGEADALAAAWWMQAERVAKDLRYWQARHEAEASRG